MAQNKKVLYQEIVQLVNQTLGRKAITVALVTQTVSEARRIRQTRGMFALLPYVKGVSSKYFTPEEMNKLKAHPRRREMTYRLMNHLVEEKVITYTEALMLKRMLV